MMYSMWDMAKEIRPGMKNNSKNIRNRSPSRDATKANITNTSPLFFN